MALNRNKIIFPAILLLVSGFFLWQKNSLTIDGNIQGNIEEAIKKEGVSPLSGISCDSYDQRPMAVVMANDPVTRPLTGLSEADLILEMPVITNDITRIIAFFQCRNPEEIGSLRSARHDFIPLAIGFDAILVHWGGSHFALEQLNAGITDNIDALKNPYSSFYQKRGIPQPHNGFTDMSRLLNAAKKLGFRMKNAFEGYPFTKDKNQMDERKILRIGYSYPYNISYQYEPQTNSYFRYRTNLKEIDKANNRQIEAKNIVVMRVFSEQIEGPDYNDLDLEGSGQCQIYQNGIVLDCVWQKSEKKPASKLKFLDKNNQEIPFVPGQTWIEMVEPHQEITWE